MTILNPTHTIYKSRKLEFEWDKEIDYRKAVATEDIYAGDLLLIEHGIYDDIKREDNIITANLLYNQELWNEMYPRELAYNLDDVLNNNNINNIIDATTAKLNSNIFAHKEQDGDKYTVLRDGQIFNHSKDNYNITYHHITVPTHHNLPDMKIFYFIAYRDIEKGKEICSNYGNDYFKEDTDLTDYNNKNSEIFTKNRNKLLTKIDTYLSSAECRDVILNHHFFNNGLAYIQQKNQYIALPKFYKTLNKNDDEDITITEMNEWINKEMLFILSFLKSKNDLKINDKL
jgi:hypothetical protein